MSQEKRNKLLSLIELAKTRKLTDEESSELFSIGAILYPEVSTDNSTSTLEMVLRGDLKL